MTNTLSFSLDIILSNSINNGFNVLVPCSISVSGPWGVLSLALNTPSLKTICSNLLSLQVHTVNQWDKNVVILEPIPNEPSEVPS